MATSITIPYDERLTDADLGRHVRNGIHVARRDAGQPDAPVRITITVEE
jgi:hypothetical protein